MRKIHGRTDVGRKSSNANESIRLICDACGVGFGEKKSLTRHLRTKHAVKVGKEKKTVAVCCHCNSTFAHRKSLYKHERKFHGADYKKSIKANGDGIKKLKDKLKRPGKIDDYPSLKVNDGKLKSSSVIEYNIDGIVPEGRTHQNDKINFFGLLL